MLFRVKLSIYTKNYENPINIYHVGKMHSF
jgi:hypothetical protein